MQHTANAVIVGALTGAVTGYLIAYLFRPLISLYWAIVWGTAIGSSLGYFIHKMGGLVKSFKSMLFHRRFAKLGILRGLTLSHITRAVGAYTSARPAVITDMDNAPGTFYTWARSHYAITLLFDQNDVCLGISNEIKNYL